MTGTEVGGRPDAYPLEYEILALKDGAVLKLTDALGRQAEIALEADDARLLALGLLGALPRQSVSGTLGEGLSRDRNRDSNRGRGPRRTPADTRARDQRSCHSRAPLSAGA